MRRAGLRRQASTFDPCPFSISQRAPSAVGMFATHIDDIPGRGEPDGLHKICDFSGQRYGELELRGPSFVRVSADLAQDDDFSATLTQDESTQSLKPLPTTPQLWAARQKTLPREDIKLRQCELGDGLGAVSGPDICGCPLAFRPERIRRGEAMRTASRTLRKSSRCGRSPLFRHVGPPSMWGNPAKDRRRGKFANALTRSTVRPGRWRDSRMRHMGISPHWGYVVWDMFSR